MKYLLLFLVLTGCAGPYAKYTSLTTLPSNFDQGSIDRYLLTQYKGKLVEQVRVVYYKDNAYISDSLVANGSSNRVTIDGLKVIVDCVTQKCNKIVLAHNHPGAYFAAASSIDLDNADKFEQMLQQAGLKAHYIIVGDADVNWLY